MARTLEDVVVSDKLYLKQWDPEGDEFVRFQRPSRLEAERLAEMQARSVLEWDTEEQGRVRQRERTPLSALETEMVAMCLVESSLKDTAGEPIFKPGVTCRAEGRGLGQKQRDGFLKAWYAANFPNELAEEIIEKLRGWHPDFDWRNPDRGED